MRGFCDLVREMSSFLIMLCWSCLYGFPEMPTMHLDFLAEFDAVTLIDAVFCGSWQVWMIQVDTYMVLFNLEFPASLM
jgi:hypothetical protein